MYLFPLKNSHFFVWRRRAAKFGANVVVTYRILSAEEILMKYHNSNLKGGGTDISSFPMKELSSLSNMSCSFDKKEKNKAEFELYNMYKYVSMIQI